MDPRIHLIRLATAALSGGNFPTRTLFDAFGNVGRIFDASPIELSGIEGMRPATLSFLLADPDEAGCEAELVRLEKTGIRMTSFEDPDYPENLREIPDPPPVLFIKGDLLPSDRGALAVIGSRKASAYGTRVCERLVRDLAAKGYCIVSGMARGIDSVAHWACIENDGRTLGVLGTGLDIAYPKQNLALFERIPLQGALISEFLPGTLARPENFPRRNRMISGLSRGVLVVEASERSGTMITVRMALEQGREVFAVPGDIRSLLSRGTHRLIKNGAKLVEGVDDILEEFGEIAAGNQFPGSKDETVPRIRSSSRPSRKNLERGTSPVGESLKVADDSTEAIEILGMLSDEGILVDTLLDRTGWPLEKLSSLLTELELLGRVKRLAGSRICRCC